MSENPWFETLPMPPLLTAARAPYVHAIRERLDAAGFDDIPRNGVRLIGGIAKSGSSPREAMYGTAVSKQAISQLVDTLVLRGYLDRTPDETDRRRVSVVLTDRGRDVAKEIRKAIAGVDAELAGIVGPRDLATTRRVLGRLWELSNDSGE